jgi:hypothetical protein
VEQGLFCSTSPTIFSRRNEKKDLFAALLVVVPSMPHAIVSLVVF